jgi:RimJ/RimL family protein N-acetyltransferase
MRIHYPIETPRLQLLPFTASDGDALYALESDPAVKRFTGGVLTRAETEQLLQNFIAQFAETGSAAIAIKRRDTGQIIGLCGLVPDGEEGELFFGLARMAWRQGFATEACRALIKAGFQQLQLQRVCATVDPENTQSIGVLERLGLRLVNQRMSPATNRQELVYELAVNAWDSGFAKVV